MWPVAIALEFVPYWAIPYEIHIPCGGGGGGGDLKTTCQLVKRHILSFIEPIRIGKKYHILFKVRNFIDYDWLNK